MSVAHFISLPLLAIFVGLSAAIGLTIRRSNHMDLHTPRKDVLGTLLCVIFGALVGAKALQLIGQIILHGSNPGFWTLANWANMMPGFGVFYGGLVGAVLAATLYIRKRKLAFGEVADILIPAGVLFHVFGRIGCFFAGCCHGFAAHWGVALRGGVPLVPVQLFESSFNLLLLTMMLTLRPERKRKGILMPLYLIAYSLGRFGLEFLRGDMNRGAAFGVSTSQWISLAILPVGLFMLWNVLSENSAKNSLYLRRNSLSAVWLWQ